MLHVLTNRSCLSGEGGKHCSVCSHMLSLWAYQVPQVAKNTPAMQETWVWSLGLKDPLEEGTATHSSILALRNLMDEGTWRAIVHRVVKSQTTTEATSMYACYPFTSSLHQSKIICAKTFFRAFRSPCTKARLWNGSFNLKEKAVTREGFEPKSLQINSSMTGMQLGSVCFPWICFLGICGQWGFCSLFILYPKASFQVLPCQLPPFSKSACAWTFKAP